MQTSSFLYYVATINFYTLKSFCFSITEKAKELFEKHIKEENIRKHCLEVSAIMKELALELGENKELWEDIGLLHDLDYYEEMVFEGHCKKTSGILRQEK